MLDDPSFKQYLKEKWDNGHAMVPHPEGGGKLIEMLSAYTGYPAYRDFISGQYQEWLNQKHQFEEPPENISFDNTISEANKILENSSDISAKDLYNGLMDSNNLSFLDKVNLLLLNDKIKNKVNPDYILGSEYIKLLNPEDDRWENQGGRIFEKVGDTTESIYLSWPSRVEVLNKKGPVAAKAFKNLTSFLTKEPFLGSYNIEPKNILREIKGFKLGEEFTRGFDLDLISSNIGNVLKENLNGETYKVLLNMADVLNGSEPKNPIKADPIWGPKIIYFHGTDHMKAVLSFIQNPAILDKENEKMLVDQIDLVNENEEPVTKKFLEDIYEFLTKVDLTYWFSADKKRLQISLNLEDTGEAEHNIQDIIFPEIRAEFEINSEDLVNFKEVTLPKGGGIHGLRGVSLIDCSGEDLLNVDVTSTINSNLDFGRNTSFLSRQIKGSRITGKGDVNIEAFDLIDSTIENIPDNCWVQFYKLINNKISNINITLAENGTDASIKDNTFNMCNITLNVYPNLASKKIADPNTFNSCKIINKGDSGIKLNGSFNNCDIIQEQNKRDVKISGNLKDCLILRRSEPTAERMSEFRFSDNGGHFDNVTISDMALRLPQSLDDYRAYSATSLILHNCHWYNRENWTEDQHNIYKNLKLRLNIQEYGKDPLADISQGFMTTQELINFGDVLEDEISVKSGNFIDDVKELQKQKDNLAKSYKRYVKKNDPQYDARIESIKKEISDLNDKIDSVHHESTTKYPIRSYFEDMPEQLYKAYLESLENNAFKKKLQKYLTNNQVEVGKNYKIKLKDIRDAYDKHKKQMDDLETRNKSSLPTIF